MATSLNSAGRPEEVRTGDMLLIDDGVSHTHARDDLSRWAL
jgi:hypothetical protein